MPDLAERVAEFNRVVEKMTPGAVVYRPYVHDDWGIVRFSDPGPGYAELGFTFGFAFAVVSIAGAAQHELDEHRRLRTDPCENDARGIAYLKNYSAQLVADLWEENQRLRLVLERELSRLLAIQPKSAASHWDGCDTSQGHSVCHSIKLIRDALAGKDGE